MLGACPLSLDEYPNILMAHGGGGTLMHQLLNRMILPALEHEHKGAQHDAAALRVGDKRIAFTTDSFVVDPLFFAGGDIGSLAVHGTVNDLAMAGARPCGLSVALILEEGLPTETLWKVMQSIRAAADAAGVQIVTGDTKVVDRGKGDGMFINTSGIGLCEHSCEIHPMNVKPDDAVIVSGDIGRHGIAIMAQREGLEFESAIKSDSQPLFDVVRDLLEQGTQPHCLRDLTRGGLASALNEIATDSDNSISIDENSIPVCAPVRGACEVLGFDPLYVACEGRFVAFVDPNHAPKALSIMQQYSAGEAQIIGKVEPSGVAPVTMRSSIGAVRVVDMLSGEQLPRIC